MYRILWTLRALFYSIFFNKIGFPTYIGKPIFLYGVSKISLGRKVRIFPMSRMEVHGKNSKIIIEDDVAIGQNFHIISGGVLVIETGTIIAPNVFINNLDNDYLEIGVSYLKQKEIVKETRIGKNCFIGIGSSIHAGTVLGEQCIVGSNAVVKGVFKDFSVIVGNPCKVIKRYDRDEKKWKLTDSKGNFIKC